MAVEDMLFAMRKKQKNKKTNTFLYVPGKIDILDFR